MKKKIVKSEKPECDLTEVKLSCGSIVLKKDYITLKTKDLIEFGYSKLTEQDVAEQVDKILNGDKNLSVIGLFCEDDLDVKDCNWSVL